jgi:hypothetical protein
MAFERGDTVTRPQVGSKRIRQFWLPGIGCCGGLRNYLVRDWRISTILASYIINGVLVLEAPAPVSRMANSASEPQSACTLAMSVAAS